MKLLILIVLFFVFICFCIEVDYEVNKNRELELELLKSDSVKTWHQKRNKVYYQITLKLNNIVESNRATKNKKLKDSTIINLMYKLY